MYPQKQNARRGYRERAMRRRTSPERPVFFPEEEKMNWKQFFLSLAILAVIVFFGIKAMNYFTPASVTPTQAPIVNVEPTKAPEATLAPVATAAPTATPAPIAMSCDTPSIKAGETAAETEFGEYLDTVLGRRMTFTSRRLLVSEKAWNDPLTPDELKTVEETWQYMQVCIPDGTTGVIFAGGFEQGMNRFETGALLSLKPGMYEFRMRNGELVIWYPGQETFQKKDLERIYDQIRVGNFDIKSPLAFFAATADLFAKVPQDLVKERNVQIAPSVDPLVH